jgi:cyclic beta-1,2-glucan synthetase
LESEVEFFVPVSDPVRVVRWRLTNQAETARRFALFGFHRLVLGTLPPEPGTIAVKAEAALAALTADYPESSPFRGPRVFASASIDGALPAGWSFTTDRAAFLGLDGGGMRQPMAVRSGGPLGGEWGNGVDACFAQRLELEIAPAQTVEVVFLLGEFDGDVSLESLISRFRQPGAAATLLDEVKTVWQTALGGIQVETPMPGLDLMVNGWLSYQAIVSRLIARTAFYQSSGAYGFRDQLQDTHGLALLWPELTREQILRHARQQFIEGDVMHWWHPQPIGRGMRTRFSDDLLWLPYVAASYVNQTGDGSIWEERVPFLQAPPLAEGQDEAYVESILSEETGTIYEHCCRAIDRSLKTGAHGLPLMGTGDWNDGMNRVGRLGQGESVWMAFFLGEVLQLMLPWCERQGDPARVARYGEHRRVLSEAVEKEAWDGEWYRRAYYDSGTPLGTASASECQIDNLAQSWAVISGLASLERAKQAMQSAWDRLVDREAGVVRLLAPSFADCPEDPGYIKGYVAGVRENGGQYTHAACWFAKALALLGRNEDAAQVLEWLTPVWHARYREETDRYRLEPYVIAADIYHGEPHTGRGGWTWYTGSAAWFYRVALETVLGLSVSAGNALILRPRVPASWPGFKIRYRHGHRGTVYEIQASREATGVTVDGFALEAGKDGVRIPIEDDGKLHEVTVGLP